MTAAVGRDDSAGGAEDAGESRSFTVRGTRNGSLVSVTWDDGHIHGDYSTVDLVEVYADMVQTSDEDDYLRQRLDRPTRGSGRLADPVFAYEIMLRTIDTIRETTGPMAETVLGTAKESEQL